MENHKSTTPNMSFVYLERKATQPNAPLLVLLHGYGSNDADLFSFAEYIPASFHVVSLQAPLTMGENSFAWFPIHFTESMERWTSPEEVKKASDYINAFLVFYIAKHDFDNENLYLMGFSQGAMLSYAVGLATKNVKGIAALSGYIDPRVVKRTNTSLSSIYVSHGTEDMVVPYAWAEQSVEVLKDYGLSPEFYSYPQGHGINQDNLISIVQWLQAQL
ncbi:MAG: phospholipase [Bacteroidetes bacterium]|nr:phospholipase [Bacteroidota bacterium]